MGALLREPLELVSARPPTCGPRPRRDDHRAEILAGARTPEGPFGEFTGYSLGERAREWCRSSAITHRRGAYFQDITVAHLDHMLLSRSRWRPTSTARSAPWCLGEAVRVPAPFTCYVSIEQRLIGQAKNAILSVLGADLYMKRVVVVDEDVNIFERPPGHLGHRHPLPARPRHHVITNARGSDLDPSSREDGYSRSGAWTRRQALARGYTRGIACRPRCGSA